MGVVNQREAQRSSFMMTDWTEGVVNKEPFSPGTWGKREECGKVYLLFLFKLIGPTGFLIDLRQREEDTLVLQEGPK